MAVKLELYRVFQEVARMGNISAAAQNLFISQSAVSQSIKQLEEQLQVRLFSRSTRGVVLTSEGKLLLDYVSHGLGLIQCGEDIQQRGLTGAALAHYRDVFSLFCGKADVFQRLHPGSAEPGGICLFKTGYFKQWHICPSFLTDPADRGLSGEEIN